MPSLPSLPRMPREVAAIIDAIGNRLRTEILSLIADTAMTSSELAQATGGDVTTIRRHLAVLEELGLVDADRRQMTVVPAVAVSCSGRPTINAPKKSAGSGSTTSPATTPPTPLRTSRSRRGGAQLLGACPIGSVGCCVSECAHRRNCVAYQPLTQHPPRRMSEISEIRYTPELAACAAAKPAAGLLLPRTQSKGRSPHDHPQHALRSGSAGQGRIHPALKARLVE